jgi:hypothetical protein
MYRSCCLLAALGASALLASSAQASLPMVVSPRAGDIHPLPAAIFEEVASAPDALPALVATWHSALRAHGEVLGGTSTGRGGEMSLTSVEATPVAHAWDGPAIRYRQTLAILWQGRRAVPQQSSALAGRAEVHTKTRHNDRIYPRLRDYCREALENHINGNPRANANRTALESHWELTGSLRKSPAAGWGQDWYHSDCSFAYTWRDPVCGQPGIHEHCDYEAVEVRADLEADVTCARLGDEHRWNCDVSRPPLPGLSVPVAPLAALSQALDAAERRQAPAPRDAPGDRIIPGIELPQFRQFNTFFSGPTFARFALPEEVFIGGRSTPVGQGLVSLLDDRLSGGRPGAMARVTPHLSFHLTWSDTPECWPDGTVNGRMELWAAGTSLGNLRVGDADYAWPLQDSRGRPLWEIQVDDGQIILSAALKVRDGSGREIPAEQRLPNTCVFALTNEHISFDRTEVLREAAHLTREARLVAEAAAQASMLPVRTLAALESAARLMLDGATGVEQTATGRALAAEAQDFLDAARPLLEGPGGRLAIEGAGEPAPSSGAIIRREVAGALVPARILQSPFVMRSSLVAVLKHDVEAVQSHLTSFRDLQTLGWTLGFLLDPHFSPPAPQGLEQAFTTGAWLRLPTPDNNR